MIGAKFFTLFYPKPPSAIFRSNVKNEEFPYERLTVVGTVKLDSQAK